MGGCDGCLNWEGMGTEYEEVNKIAKYLTGCKNVQNHAKYMTICKVCKNMQKEEKNLTNVLKNTKYYLLF